MRGCWGCVCDCRGVCVVAGGHVWLPGACVVVGGSMHGCWGGMRGCGEGCVVAGGVCIGYDEIRSMSGRYASYWNAFLLVILFTSNFG